MEIQEYLALAQQAQQELFGPQRAAWLKRLEQEHGHMQMALGQLLSLGEVELGLRLATALREFWLGCDHISEGRNWLTAFLAFPQNAASTTLRARALDVSGALAFWQSDQAMAQALMEESLTIRQELGDKPGIAISLIHLGTNKWILEGDHATARTLYDKSLVIFQELDSKTGIAYVRLNLGHLALAQANYALADALLRESLVTLRDDRDLWAINFALTSLAGVAAGQGQLERSLRLAGASEALRESLSILLPPVWQAWVDGLLESPRQALAAGKYEAAWREGRDMPTDQAIAYALQAA